MFWSQNLLDFFFIWATLATLGVVHTLSERRKSSFPTCFLKNCLTLLNTQLSSSEISWSAKKFSCAESYMSTWTWPFHAPFANMGKISGLPHDQTWLLWLNTVSKLTGFSCHPLVIAEGSSNIPAIKATCPGLDSVGNFVCEIPQLPRLSATFLRNGALSGWPYKLSALSPSATNKTSLFAGAV